MKIFSALVTSARLSVPSLGMDHCSVTGPALRHFPPALRPAVRNQGLAALVLLLLISRLDGSLQFRLGGVTRRSVSAPVAGVPPTNTPTSRTLVRSCTALHAMRGCTAGGRL